MSIGRRWRNSLTSLRQRWFWERRRHAIRHHKKGRIWHITVINVPVITVHQEEMTYTVSHRYRLNLYPRRHRFPRLISTVLVTVCCSWSLLLPETSPQQTFSVLSVTLNPWLISLLLTVTSVSPLNVHPPPTPADMIFVLCDTYFLADISMAPRNRSSQADVFIVLCDAYCICDLSTAPRNKFPQLISLLFSVTLKVPNWYIYRSQKPPALM